MLIAYAAKQGSTAEDGVGDHSPFTQALLRSLTVPGLDIRLAFGRVRDDAGKDGAERVGEGHVRDDAAAEERRHPTARAIDELVRQYEMAGRIFLLQGAACRDG